MSTRSENIAQLLRRVAPWLAMAVAIAVYANALGNGYALDDSAVIAHNPLVHHFSPFGDLWFSAYWPNRPYQVGLYRPLTILSYMVEWSVFNGHAWGFHLVNVLLHGVVSALVVVLMLRLGASAIAAEVGGLLFALHPVHVEAVAGVWWDTRKSPQRCWCSSPAWSTSPAAAPRSCDGWASPFAFWPRC